MERSTGANKHTQEWPDEVGTVVTAENVYMGIEARTSQRDALSDTNTSVCRRIQGLPKQ
jgi:hypothetical protein